VVLTLTLATAALAAGVRAVGWLLTLAVAAVTALAATTGIDLVRRGLVRLQRRAAE
jgi:hypothetical protein